MEIFKSIRHLLARILARWFFLVPGIVLGAYDIVERASRVADIPQWIFWLALGLGLFISIAWAYHDLRMEKVALERQVDEKDKKRTIRETLGGFLREGAEFKRQCTRENEEPPFGEAEDWSTRTEEYLEKSLGASYIARFKNSAGLPMQTCSIYSIEHRNLWGGINTRLARLEEFIKELVD